MKMVCRALNQDLTKGVRLVKRLTILCLSIALAAGCSTRRVTRRPATLIAPTLTVERFLQASNVRDLEEMSRLFGTYDGPIGDTGSAFGCFWKKIGSAFGVSSCTRWSEVELRMDLISDVLQHEDYQAVSERMVSGVEHPANRVGVDMSFAGGNTIRDIGFTVVQASAGRWLVSLIELEKISGG